MMELEPKAMVEMLKAQGIDAKELKADAVFIKIGKEFLEISHPQITAIRMNGAVSYTINASETCENYISKEDFKSLME